MNYKNIFKRLRENIVHIIAFAVCLISYTTTKSNDDMIKYLFIFIAFELFYDKVFIFDSFNEKLKLISVSNKLKVLLLRKDTLRLDIRILGAKNEVIITGISLFTISTAITAIKEKINQGCKVKLIICNPKSSSIDAISLFLGRDKVAQANAIYGSINELITGLGIDFENNNFELYLFDKFMSGGYVCIDCNSGAGTLYHQAYLYKRIDGSSCPVNILIQNDISHAEAFNSYYEELKLILSESNQLDKIAIKKELNDIFHN